MTNMHFVTLQAAIEDSKNRIFRFSFFAIFLTLTLFLSAIIFAGRTKVLADPVAVSGNDDHSDAWTITQINTEYQGSNVDFTTETGEFLPDSMLNTAWFKWTASASGRFNLDTCSSGGDFDTVLAIYTDAGFGSSDMVAENDDSYRSCSDASGSYVSFDAVEGTTYYIQLGGYDGEQNDYSLILTQGSPSGPYENLYNDNWANAYTIDQLGNYYDGNNTGYTNETDEYNVDGLIGKTAWFTWTATATDTFTFDTCATPYDHAFYDTVIGLFDSAGFLETDSLAWDDNGCGGSSTYSSITFEATLGDTYYFQVGTYANYYQGDYSVILNRGVPPTQTPAPSETPTPSPTPTQEPTPTPTPLPNTSSATIIPSSYVNIGEPHGLVMLPDGDIWYVDRENFRLVKMDPSTNTIVRTVGRLWPLENEWFDQMATDGEFDNGIVSITRDSDGYLYVLSTHAFVYKFDANGGYLKSYNLQGIPSPNSIIEPQDIRYDAHSNSFLIASKGGNRIVKFSKNFVVVNSFGGTGSGPGEFIEPVRVTTDDNGYIYVSDGGNARLQIFDPSYTYQSEIAHWTPDGGSEQSFEAIAGAVVLSNGTIAIENQNGPHTVELFDLDGTFISTFGGEGPLDSNMICPTYITSDGDDNLYIADPGLYSIAKYGSDGTFVSSLKNARYDAGTLYRPVDVAYHGAGNHLFIMDTGSTPRIQEFSNDGSTYIRTILSGDSVLGQVYHMAFTPDGKLLVSNPNDIRVFTQDVDTGVWSYSTYIGTYGTGNGLFDMVRGMTFDSDGNLYVADSGNHRIQIFNSSFEYIGQFGSSDHLLYPNSIAFDTAGNMYIPDTVSIQKYTSAGVWDSTIASGIDWANPMSISIDNVNNVIYVSESWGHQVAVYSTTTGESLGAIGSFGSGQVQFNEPTGSAINPVTGALTVSDWLNARVEAFQGGNRIVNLIPSANVVRTDSGHEGQSLSEQSWTPSEGDPLTAVPARLMFGDYAVADFTVNLTENRNWSGVNVLTLPGDSKALVVNLNTSNAPGISDTHSLYVYKYTNQTSVNVCPQAITLQDVGPSCTEEYTLNFGDPGLSVQNIDGKNYWKIDGLTGTGAFSSLFETTFGVKDLMTREKVATTSSHNISFGTTYGLTYDGDTIMVTFSSDWDLSGLEIGDLSLLNGSTPVTLAADPGTNTWGVAIDTDLNTITFTTPTDGTGYIPASATIHILIADSVLANPLDVGSYDIGLRLLSSDGGSGQNIETGSVTVPVVDSDQVDVTGFVNNYIVFDIDTGTASDVECGYAECQLYDGAGSAGNYTVDLGELNSAYVNKSQDTPVLHSDGETGAINSIYLDLTSNALNGTVVTVASANGGLTGPNSTIAAVADANNITANSGLYGFTLPAGTALHGNLVLNGDCTTLYCGPTTDAKTVFDSTAPLDGARVRMDLAAAAAYTDSPGSYTDTLTFVATGSF
jgi:hypothetical protein